MPLDTKRQRQNNPGIARTYLHGRPPMSEDVTPGSEPSAPGREPKVIKRYTNRKLYDTVESRYVTLDEIAEMVKAGAEVKIIDNRTKEDLTSVTLAQIIFEEEKKTSKMSLETLRDLIRHGGEVAQRLVEGTQAELRGRVEAVRAAAEQRVQSLLTSRAADQRPREGARAGVAGVDGRAAEAGGRARPRRGRRDVEPLRGAPLARRHLAAHRGAREAARRAREEVSRRRSPRRPAYVRRTGRAATVAGAGARAAISVRDRRERPRAGRARRPLEHGAPVALRLVDLHRPAEHGRARRRRGSARAASRGSRRRAASCGRAPARRGRGPGASPRSARSALEALQDLGAAVEGEVGERHRHDQLARGDEHVVRHERAGRRRVDEHRVVAALAERVEPARGAARPGPPRAPPPPGSRRGPCWRGGGRAPRRRWGAPRPRSGRPGRGASRGWSARAGARPRPSDLPACPCVSRSATRTRRPRAASRAATFTQSVVLQVPPFSLMKAIRRIGRARYALAAAPHLVGEAVEHRLELLEPALQRGHVVLRRAGSPRGAPARRPARTSRAPAPAPEASVRSPSASPSLARSFADGLPDLLLARRDGLA